MRPPRAQLRRVAPVGGQRSAFEGGAAGPDQAGDRRDALSQGGRAVRPPEYRSPLNDAPDRFAKEDRGCPPRAAATPARPGAWRVRPRRARGRAGPHVMLGTRVELRVEFRVQGAAPADLWSSCANYIANPNLASFRAFRCKLFKQPVVATAATFPAFICPDRFPMVDTQITRWASENSGAHRYSGVGGPDLECVPALRPGAVLRERDWRFVESWIAWCQFTAGILSQRTARPWRARDVEMAVFSAQRRHDLTLKPLGTW